MIFLKLILFIFILLTIFDIFLRLRPKSKLKIIPKSNSYKFNKLKDVGEYKCEFQIFNNSSNKETMIPNFIIKPLFLIENNLVRLKSQNSIFIDDGVSRKNINNYWQTIIIKSKSSIKVFITISLKNALNRKVNYLWLRLNWENYGHFGLKQRENYFLINRDIKHLKERRKKVIRIDKNYEAIAIKTNLLGAFDEPIQTIQNYCKDIVKEGDILVIGETPLAIMQGRYLHPKDLDYNFYTKILSYFFHPTSSLATACGMQLLINEVGVTRITISLVIGFIFKLIGIKGIFYILAGKQSSLIDDISGTTVPYDKTIVLGPKNPENLCKEISSLLNIDTAIADVNDLGRVKILAYSNKSIKKVLLHALKINPAGNDDQKTPILLIRRINN
tara:strand:+ start:907 stop:2070 length:1164 start_codon:yes stop_codon:yes gene_type:complete